MDPVAVLATRTAAQHLAARAPADAALDVVRDLCGLHAQVMACAELTLWARVDGLERDRVQRALWDERTLVKTWSQRGTLHLLPSDELGLWTAAQGELRPRHHQPAWLRHHGLTREQAEAMLAAIGETLADGPPLTREELAREVAPRAGVEGLEERLRGGFGDLLKPAAFRGELCFAPSEGRSVRFTHPERWLGPLAPVNAARATAEVARRYLRAHGPATREAFARWFGMTSAPQAERWIRGLGDEAVEVQATGGGRAWALRERLDALDGAAPAGCVRLLPAFDQYVVGAPRDDEEVLPAAHRGHVYRPQGWLSPVVLADGRVVGTWEHELAGERLRVAVTPFAPLAPAIRAGVEEEAGRLGTFLGGRPELVWEG